jgi:tetratricopeptide (TPR) repeat protein
LLDRKQWDEALAELQTAIAIDPNYVQAHIHVGIALRSKGQFDNAIVAYRKAIAIDPKFALAHYNLGNVLSDKGDLTGARAAYQEAIALQPDYAEAHCYLALTLQEQGEFRKALEAMRRGHELGSRKPRWPHPSADWLRRCQRLVELEEQLPGLLAGKTTPASAEEGIEIAEVCALKRQPRAALRFYEDAFAAQPRLLARHRYNAACVATRAGCGRGEDAGALDDNERGRLRSRALGWLRDDLSHRSKQLEKEPATLRQMLGDWQRDPDLEGVRAAEQLARLPDAEQQMWRQLWADVARLLERGPVSDPEGAKEK